MSYLVLFVLVFFSPFSIAITSFGEERANLSAFRTFVRYWCLGLLADSLIIGQPARLRSLNLLFCWPVLLPPGGLLCLDPLRGCLLILHARPAKARISLRIRAVWSGSSLCALWKAGIIYILYAAGYLAARMRRLNLVFACRILVYCGNCCAPDNLLYCTLPLFFCVT